MPPVPPRLRVQRPQGPDTQPRADLDRRLVRLAPVHVGPRGNSPGKPDAPSLRARRRPQARAGPVPALQQRLDWLQDRYPPQHPAVREAYRNVRVAVAARHLRQLAELEDLTVNDQAVLVAAVASRAPSPPDGP